MEAEDDYILGGEYREYEPGHPYEPYIATYSGAEFIDPEMALKAMNRGMSPGEMIKDATIGTFTNQHNTNINKMERGYTVLKLSELAKQLGLPSSKGSKTKDYLAYVINQIEEHGYRFVQFLQLVDVLYVIVQKVPARPVNHVTLPPDEFRPEQEIANHYGYGDPVLDQQLAESVGPVEDREPVTEEPPEMENVKKRDHLKKEMDKTQLPWQKK